jgi:hypothetical protein
MFEIMATNKHMVFDSCFLEEYIPIDITEGTDQWIENYAIS